jgi:hypothetical protein
LFIYQPNAFPVKTGQDFIQRGENRHDIDGDTSQQLVCGSRLINFSPVKTANRSETWELRNNSTFRRPDAQISVETQEAQP